MLRKLYDAPHLMTVDDRRAVTRSAGILAGFAVLFIVALACITAGNVVSADSPLWDAILQARLALVRLVLAGAVMLIGFYVALTLYAIFAKTALGRRIVVHEDQDDPGLARVKTANSGLILGLLFVACIGGLLLGVLR